MLFLISCYYKIDLVSIKSIYVSYGKIDKFNRIYFSSESWHFKLFPVCCLLQTADKSKSKIHNKGICLIIDNYILLLAHLIWKDSRQSFFQWTILISRSNGEWEWQASLLCSCYSKGQLSRVAEINQTELL